MHISIIGETPPLSPSCPSLGEVADFAKRGDIVLTCKLHEKIQNR